MLHRHPECPECPGHSSAAVEEGRRTGARQHGPSPVTAAQGRSRAPACPAGNPGDWSCNVFPVAPSALPVPGPELRTCHRQVPFDLVARNQDSSAFSVQDPAPSPLSLSPPSPDRPGLPSAPHLERGSPHFHTRLPSLCFPHPCLGAHHCPPPLSPRT